MAAALWDEVPTLDFSAFAPHAAVGGAPSAAQLATARRIDEVCRVHGFCKLRNVGLSAAQVDGAFGAARELFALPAEHKRTQLAQHDKQTGTNRGYFAPNTEALNAARANDIKEAFNVRAFGMDWRGTPEAFPAHASSFYAAAAELADRVLTACALALGLPPAFFAERHAQRDLCTLRLLHYPPVDDPAAAAPGDERIATASVRAGEHTDFGCITLLFVDAAGGPDAARGLQVRRPAVAGGAADDDWLDVVADEPGTVIVNTGGLLAQWTNDAWVATAHRVVVTHAARTAPRYSIAFFTDPDPEVLVECLPAFCSAANPAKYAPITSQAYLLAKLASAQHKAA